MSAALREYLFRPTTSNFSFLVGQTWHFQLFKNYFSCVIRQQTECYHRVLGSTVRQGLLSWGQIDVYFTLVANVTPRHGRTVQILVSLSSLHCGFLLVIRDEIPIPQLREQWVHSVVWTGQFFSFRWFHAEQAWRNINMGFLAVRTETSHSLTHQAGVCSRAHSTSHWTWRPRARRRARFQADGPAAWADVGVPGVPVI